MREEGGFLLLTGLGRCGLLLVGVEKGTTRVFVPDGADAGMTEEVFVEFATVG
jgi:hypothetical protein